MSQNLRVFSFGGGVQSVATLALQKLGKLPRPYDYFVFANVGNDSESPETIAYLNDIVRPLCHAWGFGLVELQKTRKGQPETLLEALAGDNKSIQIPAYMAGGAPGNRTCTNEWKVQVVNRWIKKQKPETVELGLGFSVDEAKRAQRKPLGWVTTTQDKRARPLGYAMRYEYPLLELGLSRDACYRVIEQAGLPMPPKSACWFCPFKSRSEWIEMRRDNPVLFEQALQLEARINEKRETMGKDALRLHRDNKPLGQAVGQQMSLFDAYMDSDESCQTGYCGL